MPGDKSVKNRSGLLKKARWFDGSLYLSATLLVRDMITRPPDFFETSV